MFGSTPKQLFSHTTLLVDIGSHSLAAAHVKRHRGELFIEGAVRREFTREALSISELQSRILAQLPVLLKDARDRLGVPQEVIVIVNGLFTVSQTRSEWDTLPNVVRVTPQTLRPLVQSTITHFFKEVLEGEQNQFVALDTSLLRVRLNGYDVANPFGKSAGSIGVTAHVAAVPHDFNAKIETIIKRILPEVPLSRHSVTYALFRAISEVADMDRWMIIDATGGLSELAFVERGIIQEVVSLPTGGHQLIDRVAKALSADHTTARTDLALFSRGKLEAKRTALLRRALTEAARELAQEVVKATSTGYRQGQLPRQVYIVAHHQVLPIIQALLEDPTYIEHTSHQDAPKQVWITPQWLVQQGIRFDDSNKDVFLGALALGISRFKTGALVL